MEVGGQALGSLEDVLWCVGIEGGEALNFGGFFLREYGDRLGKFLAVPLHLEQESVGATGLQDLIGNLELLSLAGLGLEDFPVRGVFDSEKIELASG